MRHLRKQEKPIVKIRYSGLEYEVDSFDTKNGIFYCRDQTQLPKHVVEVLTQDEGWLHGSEVSITGTDTVIQDDLMVTGAYRTRTGESTMAWIPIILAAIQLFLAWIQKRNSLTANQKKKINHVIAKFMECQERAVLMGCLPEGRADEKVAQEYSTED